MFMLSGVFWRGEELAAGRVVVRETITPPRLLPDFEIQVHDMAVVLCGVFLGTTLTEPLDLERF